MTYILYKHPVELTTLHIVQYLHFIGFHDIAPVHCVECNHPSQVTELPTIFDHDTQEWFVGLNRCIDYYKEATGNGDVLSSQVDKFKQEHPEYRIHNVKQFNR
jgi:hypothetical protein